MKRFVFFLVAAMSLAGWARAATPPELVTHEAAEKKSSATVRVTGTIKIVLPGRNDPDHRWQIIANDPRYIKPLSEVRPAASGKAADGAVPWEVTFVAQRPGRSIVRFVWAKIGNTDITTPDELREVTVRVQ